MYYKKLDNLNPYTVDNVKIRYYGENCAEGHAMGLDVKFFGEFVPGTDSWISFSLMKAEQSIRGSEYVPMPNSQGYNVSLFFQDYFPGYKRVKLNLKGVLSGGLPVTAPRTGYEDGYFRTPTYKRVDLGFSYQLAGGNGCDYGPRILPQSQEHLARARHFQPVRHKEYKFLLLDYQHRQPPVRDPELLDRSAVECPSDC